MRWFFSIVCGLLFAGIFVGFAKTFFLRSRFHLSTMPAYLYVHGWVLTTWFALVFAQAFLVAKHRIALHRRLGYWLLGVGAVLIPISAFVVVGAAKRPGAITPLLRLEVLGDFLTLICFAGLVGAGFYFRRQPDVHKRLMVASCFTIYGPVIARFNLVYGFPLPPPVVMPLAVVTLGAYDVIATRRLHRTTLWIAFILGGVLLPVLFVLIASGVADKIIRALR